MKIKFEETNSRKEWIHKELLQSLNGDIISEAVKDGSYSYDVKLLVNGHELEPKLFNDIMNNVEKYIDAEAKVLVEDKLDDANQKAWRLNEIIRETTENIMEEFNIEPTE